MMIIAGWFLQIGYSNNAIKVALQCKLFMMKNTDLADFPYE